MHNDTMSQQAVEEFKRLRERFEDFSATRPPVSLCLVKTCSDIGDVRKHESGLWCVPPPEPWLTLVNKGCYEDGDDPRMVWESYVIHVLIHKADPGDWEQLAVIAAHAGRMLDFVPRRVWPQISTYWQTAARTQNGWRWFTTVFDLALGPPHPKLLSVDNPDRGGFFWWQDSQSPLQYVGDGPRVMEAIKRDGRYGAVISDMAKQSALAVGLILELAQVECTTAAPLTPQDGRLVPFSLSRFSKEQKAWWWYRWICDREKKDLDETVAYEVLQELVSRKEAYVCPPWSPTKAEWPSANISVETFRKYLSRHRLQSEPQSRSADAGSVVRSTSQYGGGDHDVRSVTPEVSLPRHRQASEFRAAEKEQAARDAEAALYGFDLEPPIDSQGDPT